MAQFNQSDSRYTDKALLAATPSRRWDLGAEMEPADLIAGQKGASAVYEIREALTINATALPSNAGATVSQVPVVVQISVPMYEYGEDPVSINMNWQAAYSYSPELANNIVHATEMGQAIRNKIIGTAALDSIVGGTNFTFNGVAADPVTLGWVREGTDTASDATVGAVTTTDTLTDAKFIRDMITDLEAQGTPRFRFPDGFEGYLGFIPPQAKSDLKALTTAGSWIDFKYTESTRLTSGIIGDWEGVRWVEDPMSFYKAKGLAGCDVAAMTIFGRNFLAVPTLPQSQLAPLTVPGAIIPVNETMQIRITPAPDPAGRLSFVGAYMIMGAKIIDPRNGRRLDFYTVNRNYNAAQKALRP